MTAMISPLKTEHCDRPSPVPHAVRGALDTEARPPAGMKSPTVPHVSTPLLRLFRWYGRRIIARHFHAVRLAGSARVPSDRPLVVYSNHASWWDPMILLDLSDRLGPGRRHYAPVDAVALERYKFFKRMGFFGVEQQSLRGAAEFLQTSRAILSQPDAALWLTPQGRFADVRERPVRFQRGLGKLASRSRCTVFLPIAMEYTFWEERLPEVLIVAGQPLVVEDGSGLDAREWTRLFENRHSELQERLTTLAVQRDSQAFETVLRGTAGVNRVYDNWRAWMAFVRGERFRKEHGSL